MKNLSLVVLTLGIAIYFTSCKEVKQEIAEKQKEALPNIVFIISDDQAWTDYGFMGHEHIETPNLDKLANGSLTL